VGVSECMIQNKISRYINIQIGLYNEMFKTSVFGYSNQNFASLHSLHTTLIELPSLHHSSSNMPSDTHKQKPEPTYRSTSSFTQWIQITLLKTRGAEILGLQLSPMFARRLHAHFVRVAVKVRVQPCWQRTTSARTSFRERAQAYRRRRQ
jgi:hypothetical protein